jgi:hypothetical protein
VGIIEYASIILFVLVTAYVTESAGISVTPARQEASQASD